MIESQTFAAQVVDDAAFEALSARASTRVLAAALDQACVRAAK
jgi:hypothetical protein